MTGGRTRTGRCIRSHPASLYCPTSCPMVPRHPGSRRSPARFSAATSRRAARRSHPTSRWTSRTFSTAGQLDAGAPGLRTLEYITFGTTDEVYLAHLITRPPDVDQLIRVTLDHRLSDDDLGRGLRLTVPSRTNEKEHESSRGTARPRRPCTARATPKSPSRSRRGSRCTSTMSNGNRAHRRRDHGAVRRTRRHRGAVHAAHSGVQW